MTNAQHEVKKKSAAPAVQFHGDRAPERDEADFEEENVGLGEIPEATPLLRPPQSTPAEIANDNEESSEFVLDLDVDGKASNSNGAHDLRALAITGKKMSDRNKRQPNFCSVDVVGPDGVKKRFSPGTKAAFAIERFNCQLRDPALPVVCIVACKDGEDPIEFGPDVELVPYDDSWTLKTLREGTGAVAYVGGKTLYEDRVHKMKVAFKEGFTRALKPITKVPGAIFGPESTNTQHVEPSKSTGKSVEDVDPLQYFGVETWEDLYPGGKLPEGGPQDCSAHYIGKVAVMFIFVFAFAGGLGYMLERMPDPSRPF